MTSHPIVTSAKADTTNVRRIEQNYITVQFDKVVTIPVSFTFRGKRRTVDIYVGQSVLTDPEQRRALTNEALREISETLAATINETLSLSEDDVVTPTRKPQEERHDPHSWNDVPPRGVLPCAWNIRVRVCFSSGDEEEDLAGRFQWDHVKAKPGRTIMGWKYARKHQTPKRKTP